MPFYEFVNDAGQVLLERSSFGASDRLFQRMRRDGYHQVYQPTNAIIGLDYQGALAETDGLLAQADRGEGDLVRDRSKEAKRKASTFYT